MRCILISKKQIFTTVCLLLAFGVVLGGVVKGICARTVFHAGYGKKIMVDAGHEATK